MKAQVKKWLEILGVVAPLICLIHCLATPVLLTALPFLTAADHDHHQHTWFHWTIVGLCAIAILPAYRNHKKLVVPALFVIGGAFILVPTYFEDIERLVPTFATAIVASICLVSANLLNRKYSKALAGATACCGHSHQSQHSEV